MLGYLNNWNIFKFSNKTTTNEDFDTAHNFLLDGISDNMSELFYNEKDGAINTSYQNTMGYYFVKTLSEPYMLQDNKIVDKQVINSGELMV